MKLPIFFAASLMLFQSLGFASSTPILEDTEENQQKRVEMALSSVRAAHITFARIQHLVHDDPDKAADLCFNGIKFLMNAEGALYTGSEVK
jgi:hypothetical protein